MRVSWMVVVVAGCGLFEDGTGAPAGRACPVAVQEVVDRLDRPDETGGCLELFVAGLAEADGLAALLTLEVPLGDGQHAPGARVYARGETWTASVAEGVARASLQIGADLGQDWPCGHAPFEVDDHGFGVEGDVRVAVVSYAEAPAGTGVPVLEVDVQTRDLRIELEDGAVCPVPDLRWRRVRAPLVSE